MGMTAVERAAAVRDVRACVASGASTAAACRAAGVSAQTYARWATRYDEAGLDGLEDLPRSGRPPSCRLGEDEAAYLRRVYLRSNLREGAGSMTLAARWAAKDAASPLSEETRAAILKPRSSKHALPTEVRRACRASTAEVARYRDARAGTNDGQYTPGWLRMAEDGARRLEAGERQVWDDASVNVGVWVPWARGGDRCSDRYGVRVARFQLLVGIDCATDFCPGYSYVMRASDAYGAEDVVSALWRVWGLCGYAPAECVMEGGAWQAARTRGFLDAAGARLISAKGRPNQKLVEGWLGALWTVLSVELPARGQVGRFRGEMARENAEWRRCREGAADPREFFPSLTDFLGALDRSIDYRNGEARESRTYGTWVPAERYEAARAAGRLGHALPQGLRRFAMPVRETRTMGRGGMAAVTADDPFGYAHRYVFASERAADFDGAPVTVSFDPARPREGASLELAAAWRDRPAGLLIDAAAACVSAAGYLDRAGGVWTAGALDARGTAGAVKRASRARVGAQVAAFDGRGVAARHAEAAGQDGGLREQYGFGGAAPAVPEAAETAADGWAAPAAPDWSELERAAGLLVS